ncbi:MAG: toll/interleukin-1 receptor domain-containing protein [Luteolibacter sp.]
MDTEANVRRYWAFISYSHTDKAWADWLHKSLERYPLPKDLVGRKTPSNDPAPKRFVPVFRDREELPTATDLGAVIAKALQHARFLVVICSPRSAKSQWVEQEIISYKRLYGEDRVLCLIVEGEPWASDGKPGSSPDQECFPKAVRYRLGPDGNLSDQRTEPIAADARETGDGKQNAFIKLMAGLLGVGFDDLRRRDQEYQRRRVRIFRALTGLFALLFLAAISAAAYAVVQKQRVQKTLSQADLQLALVARDNDDISQSAAYLARSLRSDPNNRAAAVAAYSLLAHRKHSPPIGPALRHPDGISASIGSADGKWIVTACGTELYLWSRPDHTLTLKRALDGSGVTSLSLHPDGKNFAAGTISGKIHLLAFEDLKAKPDPLATLPDPIVQIAWNPKGDQLAVCVTEKDPGSNGGTLLRLAADGHELERIKADKLVPFLLAWSPDGGSLATAGSSPNVLVATLGAAPGDPSVTRVFRTKLAVCGIHFPASDRLITVDIFKGLQTWDLGKGQAEEGKELAPSVSAAAFSPDGKRFFGTRRGPFAYDYDSSTGIISHEPVSPGFTISKAAWLDNDHVLISGENGVCQERRIRDSHPAATSLCVRDAYPDLVALHPDGAIVAVGYSEDSTVRFFDTRTMQPAARPVRFPSKVLALGFSADGTTITALGWDGHLHRTPWQRAVDIQTGGDSLIPAVDSSYHKAMAGRLSPKGNLLAIPHDHEVIIADITTGMIRARFSFDRKVATLGWSKDGSKLLVARDDQLLSFHYPDGSAVPDQPVIRLNAPAIELADAGDLVAVLSNSDRIDFFNTRSGSPTGTGFYAGPGTTTLTWTEGYEWLITADLDGTILQWDPATGQAIDRLPKRCRIWHGCLALPGRSAMLLQHEDYLSVVPQLPDGETPDWLPSFLEGFCGNRLVAKKDDTLIDVDFWRSPAATPAASEQGAWADLHEWLVSDSPDPPVAPGSGFRESWSRKVAEASGNEEKLHEMQKTIQEEWNSNDTNRMAKAYVLLEDAIELDPDSVANFKAKVAMADMVKNHGMIRDAWLGLANSREAPLIDALDAKTSAAKECLLMAPPQTDQAHALIDEVLKENSEHSAATELKKQLK